MSKILIKSRRSARYDIVLCLLEALVLGFSLVTLCSVARDTPNVFMSQVIAASIGIIASIVFSFIDYRSLAKCWIFTSILCVGLIIYTYFFGIAIKGESGVNARAWIKVFGGFTFQPSELVKIGFVLTFSKHLDFLNSRGTINKFMNVVLLGVHAIFPAVLMHFQGDDGAAIIFLCVAIFMLFMAGIKFHYFLILFTVAVVIFPLLWNFVLVPYQKSRILSQFNPEADPLGMGYQQIQSKLSIGSGGIYGFGLFNGIRVENRFVPISESDFIISGIGEELGFIGCATVVLLLFSIILKIFFVAYRSADFLGSMVCFGFSAILISQSVFNLAMCTSLMPVIGITLPFFSAGGSSVICLCMGLGIVQNIFKNSRNIAISDNSENEFESGDEI